MARTGDDEEIETTLEIELHHSRWRNLVWSLVTLALAGFLIVRLGRSGLFGVVTGALVLLAGFSSIKGFIKSLLHPPGIIALGADEITLPDGLCTGHSLTMPVTEVRHAYLLRRAIPMSMTPGPVLVVETRRGIFEYPRDWFASETDPARVAAALSRRLGHV